MKWKAVGLVIVLGGLGWAAYHCYQQKSGLGMLGFVTMVVGQCFRNPQDPRGLRIIGSMLIGAGAFALCHFGAGWSIPIAAAAGAILGGLCIMQATKR